MANDNGTTTVDLIKYRLYHTEGTNFDEVKGWKVSEDPSIEVEHNGMLYSLVFGADVTEFHAFVMDGEDIGEMVAKTEVTTHIVPIVDNDGDDESEEETDVVEEQCEPKYYTLTLLDGSYPYTLGTFNSLDAAVDMALADPTWKGCDYSIATFDSNGDCVVVEKGTVD